MPRITKHTASNIQERKRIVPADIFVSEDAISAMLDHADKGAADNAEVMGLLTGSVYRDDEGSYAVVNKAVTSGLLSDDVSVRFDHSDMVTLFDALDELDYDYMIIGWYHSHLGIGCFMSETDVSTHNSVFGDLGFAIVIDPVKEEMKIFKGSKDGIKEASMVVMETQTHMA
jgi:proteasome lid subunit RPN8/RPN11